MKDKRQRMALVWPYAMYSDPALTATLLAASLPPPAYHHPGLPGPHASSYGPAASAAAFYASRFSPYQAPSALHRPSHHPQAPTYPPHHHSNSYLQPGSIGVSPSLHVPSAASYPTPVASEALSPVYRPILSSQSYSPPHSDASSDCDSASGAPNSSPKPSCNNDDNNNNTSQEEDNSPKKFDAKRSPSPMSSFKFPPSLALAAANFQSAQLQSIQSAWENRNSIFTYPSGLSTSPTSSKSTKIGGTKLFQPYKNDVPERAKA